MVTTGDPVDRIGREYLLADRMTGSPVVPIDR
jgi:hypothetical protein